MIVYQKIKGYKYRLVEQDSIWRSWLHKMPYDSDYLRLDIDGTLVAKKGYSWDGASGPTIDTKNSMRASLWHDALYQLIRLGVLRMDIHKPLADVLLKELCLLDGMANWRANLWYWAVRKFGEFSCSPGEEKRHGKIYTAP